PGNNPFGAAIQAGRNSLGQRRHLSDSHCTSIPNFKQPLRPMGNVHTTRQFEGISKKLTLSLLHGALRLDGANSSNFLVPPPLCSAVRSGLFEP
ncbi:MAG: hypothetical protein WCD64_11815, partial [Pseudolabrys sp.]